MSVASEDLENRFTYHPPVGEKISKHVAIREGGHVLAAMVNELVPDGREKSLALTKIEEAVMWANAGLARSPE